LEMFLQAGSGIMKPTAWKENSKYSKLTQERKNSLCNSAKKAHNLKKAAIDTYKKERGCCVCGEKDPIVLEFHHRDDDSKNPVLKRRHANRSFMVLGWDAMFKEMDKCDVMCANCHRRHTYMQRMMGEVV